MALERKLAGGGTIDEKEPLQSGKLLHPAIFTIVGEDDDCDEAVEAAEAAEGGRKAAEMTVAKAGDKGRLPSQTTAAQRKEDTRP